jgi:hypothetical protein
MTQKFKITEKDADFEFELDANGFIWLLNNVFQGSRINLGQEYGNIKNLDSAKENAREMLYAMNIINK